jgi:hypothetical protein
MKNHVSEKQQIEGLTFVCSKIHWRAVKKALQMLRQEKFLKGGEVKHITSLVRNIKGISWEEWKA